MADSSRIPSTLDDAEAVVSLRAVLPGARWFAADDIRFKQVAASAATCEPGELVVVAPGEADPLATISTALARGAAGLLCEQIQPCPLPQCIVGDTAKALACIERQQLQAIQQDLFTVGVIGPDGKTSTSLLIANVLRAAGMRTAYSCDLGQSDGILQTTPTTPTTTPEALYHWLHDARDNGSATAVIELSDPLLATACLDPVKLDLLVITGNSGRSDEVGPHRLVAALESLQPRGLVVVSADCPQSLSLVAEAGVPYLTYGLRRQADVSAKIYDQQPGETTLLVTAGDCTAVMETPLTGPAMAANQLAAIAVGLLSELELPAAIAALGKLRTLPGRMERLSRLVGAKVVLDAGGSVNRVAESLRTLRRERCGGKLWCVLTTPDDPDPAKAANLGRVAERYADRVIYTSAANANKASFLQACHDLLDGVHDPARPRLIADRDQALDWVTRQAGSEDTILVSGGYAADEAWTRRRRIEHDREALTALLDARDAASEPEPQIYKWKPVTTK